MGSRSDVVRRYLAAFGDGDPDEIAVLVTDDFRNEHLSELGSGCVGRDEYRRRLPGFLSTFEGARYSIVELGEIDGTDDVVARYRFEATHEGIAIDIAGIMWLTVRESQLARRIDLWDSLSFLRQTGQHAG